MTFIYHSPNGLWDYIGPAPELVKGSEYEMRATLLGFSLASYKFGSYDVPLARSLAKCQRARFEAHLRCQCGNHEIAIGSVEIVEGKADLWKALWLANIFTAEHLKADGMSDTIVEAAEYLHKLPFLEDLKLIEDQYMTVHNLTEMLASARHYNTKGLA